MTGAAVFLGIRSVALHTPSDDILDESPRKGTQVVSSAERLAETLQLEAVQRAHRRDYAAAIDLFTQSIALAPNNAIAHNNLAVMLRGTGRIPEAIEHSRRALEIDPNYAHAHATLGSSLREAGETETAILSLKQAIALKPDFAEAYFNLGNCFLGERRHREAIQCYERAIALKREYADAYSNLGLALTYLRRPKEAIEWFERGLAAAPEHTALRFNLIATSRDESRLGEAKEICERVIAENPQSAEGYNNLGIVYQALGEYARAAENYHRAVELKPDYAVAHVNLAFMLLLCGEFGAGWTEFEWRKERPDVPKRAHAQHEWQGESLANRTILLYGEQGLGDCIQCLRYVPAILAQARRVIVELPRTLIRLGASLPSAVILRDEKSNLPMPQFDVQCALFSLPARFDTRLDTIPKEVPYLSVRQAIVERWRKRLGPEPGLKVGLVWAGNPNHINDRHRSIAFEEFLPLLGVPGVRWYSLQVGHNASDPAKLAPGLVTDLSAELKDFSETGGAMANLDLVICADTAVAHLAGALARPVWVLLPLHPDWRWMLGREESPWYPTMRLFRQATAGDWADVLRRVRQALELRLGTRRQTARQT